MSESPKCPTCGYVMCEDFDERGNRMIPNGKYVCYLCKKTIEPMKVLMVDEKDREPADMSAAYIAQLTHELYARTGMYPNSRELHERAMAIKAEVTRRLLRLEEIDRKQITEV